MVLDDSKLMPLILGGNHNVSQVHLRKLRLPLVIMTVLRYQRSITAICEMQPAQHTDLVHLCCSCPAVSNHCLMLCSPM